ncbi:MAG: hypothetical protein GIKADHBN_02101 [Phycisphaerales bacterium]|nr:hypothetical protein [Phycisphaerales bacterium]
MHLPDDFGLSPVATFAHVGDRSPSWRHSAYWSAWEKAVSAATPALRPASSGADRTDPTATHQYESLLHATIGATLVEPPAGTAVRAGLVSVHGYHDVGPLAGERERWESLADAGVATLAIRVRGFAGSAAGCGLLTTSAEGWVTHGLESLVSAEDGPVSVQVATWVVPQAVADVVNGVRALARWLGGAKPVFLHGRSLGGGLAIMAAAKGKKLAPVSRIVLELPSLGDWRWRLDESQASPGPRERDRSSAGYQIRALLERHQHEREKFVSAVRIADAVVHAHEASAPLLVKLAERDEVVPAPSAAAIFNAAGSEPGRKWRFLVPFGHFDGGLRNARRHALFDRVADAFLDPSNTPEVGIGPFLDVLESGERPAVPPRQSPRARQPVDEGSLFGAAVPEVSTSGQAVLGEVSIERVLTDAYRAAGRTLDDLPYTPEFGELAIAARAGGVDLTDRALFHKLHNLRKAGRLPRLGRSASGKTAVRPDEEALLARLVEDAVGSLGQRDQLPYSNAFDRLVWDFNQRTGRSLAAYEVWRLVATLSK